MRKESFIEMDTATSPIQEEHGKIGRIICVVAVKLLVFVLVMASIGFFLD